MDLNRILRISEYICAPVMSKTRIACALPPTHSNTQRQTDEHTYSAAQNPEGTGTNRPLLGPSLLIPNGFGLRDRNDRGAGGSTLPRWIRMGARLLLSENPTGAARRYPGIYNVSK